MIEVEHSIILPISSREDLKPEFPYLEQIIPKLELVYMWPNTRKRNCFHYHLAVWIAIIILTTFLLSCILHVVLNYEDFDSIAFPFSLSMDITATIFRYTFVYVRGEKYTQIVSAIHNDFNHYSLFPNENRTSIMRYYKKGHRMFYLYQSLFRLYIVVFCIAPVLIYYVEVLLFPPDLNETSGEEIPFPVVISGYAPFDNKKQPGSIVFYIHQVISFALLAWVYYYYDAFICIVLSLTIGQFDLIKESLRTISVAFDSTDELKQLKQSEIQSMEDAFKHCIRQHQFTRRFVSLLDEIISPNMLFDTILAVISMSNILLESSIAINLGDQERSVNSFINVLAMTIHIFLYNYLGNELTSKEEELREAIYDIPWHRFPKQKHLFLFTMAQARRPCKLTGGKLFKLSLEFFTTMMRGAFSYFTFLMNFRNEPPSK